jgi:hypothetical protein
VFYDFVDSRRCRVGLHYFDQSFGHLFGVDFASFIQGLREGIDSKKTALGGRSREKRTQSTFVGFDVCGITCVAIERDHIRDAADFRDLGGQDELIGGKIRRFSSAAWAAWSIVGGIALAPCRVA